MRALPNTPSQNWARRHAACARGRRDLGRRTIGQYFRTSVHRSNVYWILCRLTTFLSNETGMYELPAWVAALAEATPKEIRAAAYANGVMIPLEIS